MELGVCVSGLPVVGIGRTESFIPTEKLVDFRRHVGGVKGFTLLLPNMTNSWRNKMVNVPCVENTGQNLRRGWLWTMTMIRVGLEGFCARDATLL
jgi:hypothetical protein